MPNSIMYQEDCYVVISPKLTEQFLSLAELEDLLQKLLIPLQSCLPEDLKKISGLKNIKLQVERLVKTACELDGMPSD
jgi:Protein CHLORORESPIRATORY REDUCTION 7